MKTLTTRALVVLLRAAVYATIALLVFLLLARYLGLPVAAVIVAGYSMTPTYEYGDLVIVEKVEDPSKLQPGDVVLWCPNPRACVLHRLVEVRSDGRIVTKGDANPVPDPPIPASYVKYRAVAVIPRIAYLAPLAAYFTYTVTRLARAGIALAGRAPEVGLAAIFIAYTIVILITPYIIPAPVYNPPTSIIKELRPYITLVRADVSQSGDIKAVYTTENIDTMEPIRCTIGAGAEILDKCTVKTERRGEEYITIITPVNKTKLYTNLYLQGQKRIEVRADYDIGAGVFKALLLMILSWKTPTITAIDNKKCTITITNPNIEGTLVPATIKAKYYNRTRTLPSPVYRLVETETIHVTLKPGDNTIQLKCYPRVIVVVEVKTPGGGTKTVARAFSGG